MNRYNKTKNRLEQFLQTNKGKRAIHFAYSFGAALVILGAMFKLLHFPFGNEMLFIGMITEVFVFILSAFDTPVRDYPWETVFPVLDSKNPADRPHFDTEMLGKKSSETSLRDNPLTAVESTRQPLADQQPHFTKAMADQTEIYNQRMEQLNNTLAGLNTLYEVQLKNMSGQIETIEQINSKLQQLRKSYGEKLPAGAQIGDETERLASQLRELNETYARMLQAMTHNPHNPGYPHNHKQ